MKSKFSRWTISPQQKLCLGEVRTGNWPFYLPCCFQHIANCNMKVWDLLTIERNGLLISAQKAGGWGVVNTEVKEILKEICHLCRSRVRLSEIKHFGRVHTMYRVYFNFTFMLRKFIFCLSENIKLNNYWFWMSFLAFPFVQCVFFIFG